MVASYIASLILSGGDRGVFEISELASLLRRENCTDLFVVRVDPALAYVDYLVVATCRSRRHLMAVAEYLNKAYKRKTKHREGLRLEGSGRQHEQDWIAVDMGQNRMEDVVHISPSMRLCQPLSLQAILPCTSSPLPPAAATTWSPCGRWVPSWTTCRRRRTPSKSWPWRKSFWLISSRLSEAKFILRKYYTAFRSSGS